MVIVDYLPRSDLPEVYIKPNFRTVFAGIAKRYLFVTIFLIAAISLIIFLFFAPPRVYFGIYSFIFPQALKVGSAKISWGQLSREVILVNRDRNLKNREQQILRAIDRTIENEILRQYASSNKINLPDELTSSDKYRLLRQTVTNQQTDWRTGGYFIIRFNSPEATESANILKELAKKEIMKLQSQLKKSEDFQKLLVETSKNQTIEYLNGGAFLPGVFLDKATRDKFPLKIKTLEDEFFNLNPQAVSDILTLSWDDYSGPGYGQKFNGEFAFAVIRIYKTNNSKLDQFQNYDSWLSAQKQKFPVKSYVFIPFFFKLI